jgi:hypothetical protein
MDGLALKDTHNYFLDTVNTNDYFTVTLYNSVLNITLGDFTKKPKTPP